MAMGLLKGTGSQQRPATNCRRQAKGIGVMTDLLASHHTRYMALEPFIVADRRHIPVAVVRKQALRWASAVLKASELPSAASDFEGLTILVTDSAVLAWPNGGTA